MVAVISGILLLPFFRPSMATVVYHGSYRVLDGVPMSRAYQSVLATSLDMHGGLLTRQVHHWSADIFIAAICLRLLRVFFRGQFSGRHLRGWLTWLALLPLGMLDRLHRHHPARCGSCPPGSPAARARPAPATRLSERRSASPG